MILKLSSFKSFQPKLLELRKISAFFDIEGITGFKKTVSILK